MNSNKSISYFLPTVVSEEEYVINPIGEFYNELKKIGLRREVEVLSNCNHIEDDNEHSLFGCKEKLDALRAIFMQCREGELLESYYCEDRAPEGFQEFDKRYVVKLLESIIKHYEYLDATMGDMTYEQQVYCRRNQVYLVNDLLESLREVAYYVYPDQVVVLFVEDEFMMKLQTINYCLFN